LFQIDFIYVLIFPALEVYFTACLSFDYFQILSSLDGFSFDIVLEFSFSLKTHCFTMQLN